MRLQPGMFFIEAFAIECIFGRVLAGSSDFSNLRGWGRSPDRGGLGRTREQVRSTAVAGRALSGVGGDRASGEKAVAVTVTGACVCRFDARHALRCFPSRHRLPLIGKRGYGILGSACRLPSPPASADFF